jgi:hypothetical protein
MASAKRKKKVVRKSKDVAQIEGLTKANDLLLLRLAGLEYLSEFMLEAHLSALTPEQAEELAVLIVRGAPRECRVFLTEFIARSKGYGIAARKIRSDQRLQ